LPGSPRTAHGASWRLRAPQRGRSLCLSGEPGNHLRPHDAHGARTCLDFERLHHVHDMVAVVLQLLQQSRRGPAATLGNGPSAFKERDAGESCNTLPTVNCITLHQQGRTQVKLRSTQGPSCLSRHCHLVDKALFFGAFLRRAPLRMVCDWL
jgi:hypothetical protein